MEGDWGQGRPSGGEEFNPLSAMVKAVDMQEERNNGSYQFSGGAELVRLSGQVINTFNQHQGGQPASGEISSCQQDRSVPLSAATSQARENQIISITSPQQRHLLNLSHRTPEMATQPQSQGQFPSERVRISPRSVAAHMNRQSATLIRTPPPRFTIPLTPEGLIAYPPMIPTAGARASPPNPSSYQISLGMPPRAPSLSTPAQFGVDSSPFPPTTTPQRSVSTPPLNFHASAESGMRIFQVPQAPRGISSSSAQPMPKKVPFQKYEIARAALNSGIGALIPPPAFPPLHRATSPAKMGVFPPHRAISPSKLLSPAVVGQIRYGDSRMIPVQPVRPNNVTATISPTATTEVRLPSFNNTFGGSGGADGGQPQQPFVTCQPSGQLGMNINNTPTTTTSLLRPEVTGQKNVKQRVSKKKVKVEGQQAERKGRGPDKNKRAKRGSNSKEVDTLFKLKTEMPGSRNDMVAPDIPEVMDQQGQPMTLTNPSQEGARKSTKGNRVSTGNRKNANKKSFPTVVVPLESAMEQVSLGDFAKMTFSSTTTTVPPTVASSSTTTTGPSVMTTIKIPATTTSSSEQVGPPTHEENVVENGIVKTESLKQTIMPPPPPPVVSTSASSSSSCRPHFVVKKGRPRKSEGKRQPAPRPSRKRLDIPPRQQVIDLKKYNPTAEEQKELYANGCFLVEAGKVGLAPMKTTLYRVHIMEDKSITLQKYEPVDLSGREFHRATTSMLVVDARDKSFFQRYHPVYVLKIIDTAKVSVYQYIHVDHITPYLLKIRTTKHLFGAFYTVAELIFRQVIHNGDFIKARIDTTSEIYDPLAKEAWDIYHAACRDRAKDLMGVSGIASGFWRPFIQFPQVRFSRRDRVPKGDKKNCGACIQRSRIANFFGVFRRMIYDEVSFQPEFLKDSNVKEERNMCGLCKIKVYLAWKLTHHSWYVYNAIRNYVVELVEELDEDEKLNPKEVIDSLLGDYEWLARTFLDFQVLLAESDYAIGRCIDQNRRKGASNSLVEDD
ncbi:uncharacterized protein LOC110862124 [Folsomia candida]|nr:uncharacterized protein LOC110862124 [Folsomia candida]